MHAPGAKSRESDDRMEAQLELLRSAVAELRTGTQAPGGRGEGLPSVAGSSTDPPKRTGAVGSVEQVVLLQLKEPQLRSETAGAEAEWKSADGAGKPKKVSAPRSTGTVTVQLAMFEEAAESTRAL